MIQLDRDQVATGYWRPIAQGLPALGFLSGVGATAEEIAEIWHSLRAVYSSRSFMDREMLLFALEAEHRRRPIASLRALRAAATRIAGADYDLTQARAVADARLAAEEESRRAEEDERRARWLHSVEGRREAEFKAKQLPVGQAENLTLIKRLVGLSDER